MPYGPLYGIFWGHILCKYGWWGWSEIFSLSVPDTPRERRCLQAHPRQLVQEAKRPHKAKNNRTNSTKEYAEQFEGVTWSLPSKTRVLRQVTPESSPERSVKSLSHSFFVAPFLSPTYGHKTQEKKNHQSLRPGSFV